MAYRLHSFNVNDRALVQQFIKVPWSIYHDDPHWVPPLVKERQDLLSPKHPYFEHAEVKLWIAYKDDQAVGRISAQFDQLKSVSDYESIGYFGLFECIDDSELAIQLLTEAEQWLKKQDCDVIRGPFNLSINQESGLLINGFDTPPYIMMGHAKPYYQALLQEHGYAKAKDLYAWFNRSGFVDPPAMLRLAGRYQSRIVLRDVDKKQFDRDIRIMMHIFNDAWANNWGFIPFTENEFVHLGKEMLQLIPANHFKIAELDGEPVAMVAGLPNFNQIIKDLNGKLFPLGVFKLLWRLKFSPPTTGRVALLGIKQQYQNQLIGSALAFLLIKEIKQVAHATGIVEHEMSWVLEDNKRLNKILESLGAERYKTYRVYEKRLSNNKESQAN